MSLIKDYGKTERFAQMVAEKQGWVVNEDRDFVSVLIEGLTANYNRYGYYLCPCRDSEGSREADKSVICPCVFARSDIEKYGHCFCALYLSREFLASGKQPVSIPERRHTLS